MTRILVAISLMLSCMILTVVAVKPSKKTHPKYNLTVNPIDMPIVRDDPYAHLAYGGEPVEQREAKYRKWLAVSLKIQVSNASGSGTIVYYDPRDGYAYVQSCGHLWDGNMTAEEGKRKNITCKVITWYHNQTKLSSTREYPAEVIYYSNTRGADCSLLRFKPDWVPEYVPIAPPEFDFRAGMRLHSCGCDGGREVAHYDVRVIGMRDADLCTTENSPRPGRSGGGLMTDDLYVGICWGTSKRDGTGNGYFTPLKVFREYNQKSGYGWLNDVGVSWAQQLPIVDRNNPQGQYPKNYIPLPGR